MAQTSGCSFKSPCPSAINLDVETQGGDITVEAPLEGEARLTTAGGDVRYKRCHGRGAD